MEKNVMEIDIQGKGIPNFTVKMKKIRKKIKTKQEELMTNILDVLFLFQIVFSVCWLDQVDHKM